MPLEADAARAGAHLGAALMGVEGVEHDETRIVDPAVRIHEAAREGGFQGAAGAVPGQVDRPRGGQEFARRQAVVEEEAGADQPGGPLAAIVGHHEAQRVHDVGRAAQQDLALGQGLAYQAELVVFEVAQAAVHQLAGRR